MALVSDNLVLPLIFLYLPRWNLLKCSQFVTFFLPNISKLKQRGYKGSFLTICNFVFSSSISNFVSWFFLSTSTRKGTNIFNGPANLRNFHRRKRDKSCLELVFNPLTPMTNHDTFSAYDFNTISSKQLMRIKKYLIIYCLLSLFS